MVNRCVAGRETGVRFRPPRAAYGVVPGASMLSYAPDSVTASARREPVTTVRWCLRLP